MTRSETFKLRMAVEERRLLMALSHGLARTQSDTIRLLIREAAKEILTDNDATQNDNANPVSNLNK